MTFTIFYLNSSQLENIDWASLLILIGVMQRVGGMFRSSHTPIIMVGKDSYHDAPPPPSLKPHFSSRHVTYFHAVVLEKLAAVVNLHLVVTVNRKPKCFALKATCKLFHLHCLVSLQLFHFFNKG